ncbi:MAG: S-methyl-5-thioribose-1-phosphate isomerase, partial [Actinomycetota bacterium]|nr:S-methyl-5-thioribose-1-phosphate isomerase [Actinomycetota bacterium]
IDMSISDGSKIPIEERSPEEIINFAGVKIASDGVKVANPAFDVTPNRLITAIITDKGILRPPYKDSIAKLFS